ncbi:RING finger protein 17-like [Babylonia areolata]|uniref:RING finger protein 17-like n=1 Tax=Babylonia areolata TaxID=304850 RepID=UPI003FD3E72C
MKPPTCSRCNTSYLLGGENAVGQRTQRDYGKYPLLLHCGHSFCGPCVRKCKSTQEDIQCPMCQKRTRQGPKGISPDLYTVGLMWSRRMQLDQLSDKIFAGRTKDRKKPTASGDAAKKGTNCVECQTSAHCQCLKCDSVLCIFCFDRVHSSSHSLAKHQPSPLEEGGPLADRLLLHKRSRARNCTTHEHCQIEYFCNQDNQPICSRCVIVGDHKGHDVQTLEEKNKESLSEMEPAMVGVQETIWRLEKAEQVISNVMPMAQVDTNSLLDEVQLHFQGLHSLLQAREEQLVEEIREASANATKPFEETKSYLQTERSKLEIDLIDGMRAMQGSIHTLVDADLILERLKKAQDIPCIPTLEREAIAKPIRCSFDTPMKDLIGSYGSISSRSATQMFTLSLPGTDSPKPPPEELRSVSLPDADLASLDSGSLADSASVIVEEEEVEAVADGEVMEHSPAQTVMDSPCTRLVVGRMEKVQVTHIRTPTQFYVQLMRDRGELETLQRHINQHCRQSAQQGRKGAPPCLDPGTVVLAQFSQDKNWYRAVITSMVVGDAGKGGGSDKGGASCDVFFMDYGNSERVSLSKLQPIKKKFETPPAFAYECMLYDLQPANKVRGWTEKAVKVMLDMISSGTVLLKVMGEQHEGVGGLPVDVVVPERQRQCVDDSPSSLRHTLLFLRLAASTSITPPSPPGSRARQDYIPLARAQDGQVMDVIVSHMDSPSLFFVQVYEKSTAKYIERLADEMQGVYSGDSGQRYTIFCPKDGMLCMAKYHSDGRWYRARVTGLPGAGKVQVHFVDFGNTEIVDHKDLRKILQDHIKLPQQAIQCSLVDVEPAQGSQWSDEALSWFRTSTEHQFSQIRVVGHSDRANQMRGVLYIISQLNQLSCVNVDLVKHGWATSTGPWSQKEWFEGITLEPDPATMPSSSSSSSSPSTHYHSAPPSICPGSAQRLSPRHPTSSPPSSTPPHKLRPSPKKGDKAGSPSPRSGAQRRITLKNLHKSPERPGTGAGAGVGGAQGMEEGAGSVSSVGVEVVITGYRTPAHFFIQLQEKQADLTRLMTELAAHETEAPPERAWKAGEFCVAKYSQDDRWYRAKITTVLEDGSYVVSLMDYGYTDTVPGSWLRVLKKGEGQKECFAERCHLVNLAPAGSMDVSRWSSTAVTFMADEIKAKRLFVKLEGNRTEDLGLPVDILIERLIPETALDPVRHEYLSLVSRIQDQGLAIPRRKPSSNQGSDPESTQSPHREAQGSDLFHTRMTVSPVTSASADNTVRGEEEGGDIAEEVEVIEQPEYDVRPHPPPASTTFTILTVHVDSEGLIYAHDHQDEEECTAFMDQVDHYAKTQAPKGQLEVRVGQVCLAHYSPDNAWYRARVLEITQNKAKVKYLDYGNTQRVDRNMLRLISPELCVQHQMAYTFRLHNVKPDTVDDSWPPVCVEFMERQLVNCKWTAIIKGDRSQVPQRVEVVDSGGESLVSTLLTMGVVTREDDMEDYYERTADITNILQHSNPFYPLRPGDAGTMLTGLVTHMELPNLVYIQRCAASPDNSLPEDLVRFAQMMEDLNQLPPTQDAAPLEEVPSAGEMCCARFSEDDRWYRGLVAKTFPHNQTALVYYVDYGNSEIVTLDRLQALPAQFRDTPAQALRAFLNVDLPPGGSRWTLSSLQAMSGIIFMRRHIVLVKFTDPLTVELFSEDEHLNGAAILSYQRMIDDGLVTIPKPLEVPDEDAVIVESCSEEGEGGGASSNSELD